MNRSESTCKVIIRNIPNSWNRVMREFIDFFLKNPLQIHVFKYDILRIFGKIGLIREIQIPYASGKIMPYWLNKIF